MNKRTHLISSSSENSSFNVFFHLHSQPSNRTPWGVNKIPCPPNPRTKVSNVMDWWDCGGLMWHDTHSHSLLWGLRMWASAALGSSRSRCVVSVTESGILSPSGSGPWGYLLHQQSQGLCARVCGNILEFVLTCARTPWSTCTRLQIYIEIRRHSFGHRGIPFEPHAHLQARNALALEQTWNSQSAEHRLFSSIQ